MGSVIYKEAAAHVNTENRNSCLLANYIDIYATSIASSCGGQAPCSLDKDLSRPARHLRGASANGSTCGASTGLLHEWSREGNITGAEYGNGFHSYTDIAYYLLLNFVSGS